MSVFRQKMKAKALQMKGKRFIADSIYVPGKEEDHQDEIGMFSIPRSTDDIDLKVFKSRSRARHESFNGRIKFFGFLRSGYQGNDMEKHGVAFRAICVIVQYQMDNGSPLFDVN